MPCLGEGVIFTHPDSLYTPGRVSFRVRAKLKLRQDDEAKVVGYSPGALLVSFAREKPVTFKLSLGLTRAQKANLQGHFPRGTRVTFSFRSLTLKGKPKEARLVRIRPKADMT